MSHLIREVEVHVTNKIKNKLHDVDKPSFRLQVNNEDCRKELFQTIGIIAGLSNDVKKTESTDEDIQVIENLKESSLMVVNCMLDCDARATSFERIGKNGDNWTPQADLAKDFTTHVKEIKGKRAPDVAQQHPYYKKYQKLFKIAGGNNSKNGDDDDIEIQGDDKEQDILDWTDPLTKEGPEDVYVISPCEHRLNKKSIDQLVKKHNGTCPVRGCTSILIGPGGQKMFEPDVAFAVELEGALRRKGGNSSNNKGSTTATTTTSSSRSSRVKG
jgi:hypothetical protein